MTQFDIFVFNILQTLISHQTSMMEDFVVYVLHIIYIMTYIVSMFNQSNKIELVLQSTIIVSGL